MRQVPNNELDRQYRCLRQMISMHSILRDEYHRLGALVDLVLLACAVVFCATTFAHEYIATRLGVSGQVVADVLGVASIMAFLAAIAALVLDWKGKAVRHSDAAKTLTNVLASFKEAWNEGVYPEEMRTTLSQTYWNAMQSVDSIPDRRFAGLKVRHLRKMEISRTASTMPGCPLIVIRLIVFCRSVWMLRNPRPRVLDEGNGDASCESDSIDGQVSRGEGDRD